MITPMNEAETKIMKLEQKHIEALDKAEKWMFHSDFCPYLELKELLHDETPEAHDRFRSLFINYYGLNTGGLTDEFKNRFFGILFGTKVIVNGRPNFSGIFDELSGIKRKKGDYAMQFSFISKLVSIHLESSPIYDKHVLDFFGEKASAASTSKKERIEWFEGFLDRVSMCYQEWAKDERIKPILTNLKARDDKLKNCHDVRLLDFLIWKVGNKKFLT